MRHGVRALERRLVRERAEIGVAEVVNRLLRSWDEALDQGSSPPEPLALFKALAGAGFYLSARHRALQYLDQCLQAAALPDRDQLLRMLLPTSRSS